MRGKVCLFLKIRHCGRITPAYAGKSKPQPKAMGTFQDHPRLCGEKVVLLICTLVDRGSPPPMRGKVDNIFAQLDFFRITPAYAGKSSAGISRPRVT